MAAIGEPTEIARYVSVQLKDYKYTCPPAPNVGIYLSIKSV